LKRQIGSERGPGGRRAADTPAGHPEAAGIPLGADISARDGHAPALRL